MDYRWKNPTTLYFTKLPEMTDFCNVTLVIKKDILEQNGGRVHQLQVMKCRELIFTEANILATPSLDDIAKIYLVMHQALFKSKILMPKFNRMGLQIEKVTRLLPSIFQSSFVYTMTAKLAPTWNKVGKVFVQGRDFIQTSTRLNAVKMDITVVNEEITLALEASNVKLPTNRIQDFEICVPVIEKFFMSKSAVINEFSIEDKWCYVMPSMKKGKLVNITHDIPKSSPFSSYKDIKRHWKNMYGYRLPESDELVFFNVYFPAIGNILFTYPECCVRKRDLVVIPRSDSESILNAFLTDVQNKMPTVCGVSLKIGRKPQYSTTTLCEASSNDIDQISSSLSDEPPQRKLPARRNVEKIYTNTYHHPVCSQTSNNLFRNAGFLSANASTTQTCGIPKSVPENIPKTQRVIPIFKAQCIRTPLATKQPVKPRTVPSFKPVARTPIFADQSTFPSASVKTQLSSQYTPVKRNLIKPSFSSQPIPGKTLTMQPVNMGVGKTQIIPAGKRKKQDAECNETVKKQRTKPKVQENVDIGSLAACGQLSKVNTITLISWLKERSIVVKAKDKKGDLIQKVMIHLQLRSEE